MLRALQEYPQVQNIIINSGQHYDFRMSQIFFDDLDLSSPKYNLEVGSGTHGVQTGLILARLDPILKKENPGAVLVYGDTNTTLAGALTAYKNHYRLAHIEAGLRENVWRPEEINRKLSDHCSDFLFCPTRTAAAILRREGIQKQKIFFSGDITYDAFLWALQNTPSKSSVSPMARPFFLMTLHRAETVDHKEILSEVISVILSLKNHVIFPVHPRTLKYLKKFDLLKALRAAPHITLMSPVGYFDFLRLLTSASLIITDSGGVIKEAFYAKKPCITLDDTTEYIEIQKSGANLWAGKTRKSIFQAIQTMRNFDTTKIHPEKYFGTGRAAQSIVKTLLSHLNPKAKVRIC